jgi:hypothetical protein
MFGAKTRRRLATLEAAAGEVPLPPAPSSAIALDGGIFGYWPGGGVTRADAMAVPTLAYIRSQLSGGVSAMPLERFRVTTDPLTGDKVTVKVDPGWCENPDPAPGISDSLFWGWIIDDLFFNGKSTLIVLARDSSGFPVAFRRVIPGQLTYDPDTLALGVFWPTRLWYQGVEVPLEDVKVIAGPHEGICNYGAQLINAALALELNAATAANEPLPNIDLHQTAGEPLSKDDAANLVSQWKAARQLGATAYTPQNLDARTIGWSAADQQMVEARQYMATQLARLAGVNPVLVSAAMGSSSSYVYTNQADYRQAFLDDVLDSYLQAIEGRLSANDISPRGQYFEFDRDEFTRLPLLERVQVMVGALRSGATPEMVNQLATVLDLEMALPVAPSDQPLPVPVVPPAPPPAPPPASTPSIGGP